MNLYEIGWEHVLKSIFQMHIKYSVDSVDDR